MEVHHERLPIRFGAAIGAGCAALLAALWLAGAFDAFDQQFHDLRYRLRGSQPASDRIALVQVDDETIQAYRGEWPLPRSTYAMLVDALSGAGAAATAFDLLFMAEDASDPTGDGLLAAVTREHPTVVHAVSFQRADASLGGQDAGGREDLEGLIRHGRPVTRQRLPLASQVSLPYPALLDAAPGLGHTAIVVENDGVARRVPLYVRYGDWAYPSLAIRLVESAARSDSALPQFELADRGILMHRGGRSKRIPVDAEGASELLFAGDRRAFPHNYSLLRVLQWYRDGDTTALHEAFGGKLVLVGVTAEEQVATDLGATPFSGATPLVYLHANAVHSVLTGRFLSRVSRAGLLAALLALGGAMGMAFARLPLRRSAMLAAGALVSITGMDMVLFLVAHLDVPPTAFLLLSPLAWIAVEARRRSVTERHARDREREQRLARDIQQHLLPSTPPAIPEFDCWGINVPADAVGGDYYDWVPIGGGHLAVVVGDVSGHGVPAALLMSHLRASFHAEARPGIAPREILAAVHASLTRAAIQGRFATFFLALLSREDHSLSFSSAGHNPMLLLRDGQLERLGATGLPLAMIEGMPYSEESRPFLPGDALVLYSDGIPEAPRGAEFYGEERLESLASERVKAGDSAEAVGKAILRDVSAFAGEALATDDVTIVVVRRRA